MRRPFGLITLVLLLLASSITVMAKSQHSDISNETTVASSPRFVVFESFLRSTCGNCKAAAPDIDLLAQEYVNQPVVFLEYDVDNAPASRKNRFWDAYGGSSINLPMIIVDSGNQFTYGYTYFYYVYKWMVDDALARPAQADIQAGWRQDGNKIEIYAKVKNMSGMTLSSSGNSATIFAIVYEDAHVKLTNRFVRTTVEKEISNLAPNETAAFTLKTSKLSNVNWQNLHVIVLVDYRPNGNSGAYDMLQATEASQVDAQFSVAPDTFTFLVDPGDASISPVSVNFLGLDTISWNAVQNGAWFTIFPSSGTITTQPTITVDKNSLSDGLQQGSITFTSLDGQYSDQVTINTYLGEIKRVYLPIGAR